MEQASIRARNLSKLNRPGNRSNFFLCCDRRIETSFWRRGADASGGLFRRKVSFQAMFRALLGNRGAPADVKSQSTAYALQRCVNVQWRQYSCRLFLESPFLPLLFSVFFFLFFFLPLIFLCSESRLFRCSTRTRVRRFMWKRPRCFRRPRRACPERSL